MALILALLALQHLALITNLNVSYPTNVTSMGGYFCWVNNTATQSWGFTLLMLAIFSVEILAMRKYDILPVVMASAFSCALLSSILVFVICGTTPLIAIAVPITFALIAIAALVAWIFRTQN